MNGYKTSTYGDRIAEVYDEVHSTRVFACLGASQEADPRKSLLQGRFATA